MKKNKEKITRMVVLIASLICLVAVICMGCQNKNKDTENSSQEASIETSTSADKTENVGSTEEVIENSTTSTEDNSTTEEKTTENPTGTTEKPNASTTEATTEEKKPNSSNTTTEAPKTTQTTTTESYTPSTTEAYVPTTTEETTEATTEATTEHTHEWVDVYGEKTEFDYSANVCNNCGFVDYPEGWSGMSIGEHCLMCKGKDDKGWWIGTSYHLQDFYKTVSVLSYKYCTGCDEIIYY